MYPYNRVVKLRRPLVYQASDIETFLVAILDLHIILNGNYHKLSYRIGASLPLYASPWKPLDSCHSNLSIGYQPYNLTDDEHLRVFDGLEPRCAERQSSHKDHSLQLLQHIGGGLDHCATCVSSSCSVPLSTCQREWGPRRAGRKNSAKPE